MRIALLVLLALGCRTAPEGDRIRVAVSVPPQADLVRRIGGDRVEVEALVAPGASDEDLSLSPRKAVALERTDLYVKVGHPAFTVEARYVDPFLARHPRVRVVDMSRGMDLHHEEEDDGHGHEGDPHVWVAPKTMTIAARNIAAALSEADPEHAAEYRANLARFLEDVRRLDSEIRARLEGGQRSFLVYHPSWGYFARQYGLTQIAIEADGKEPGAARLIRLIERARQEGAEVVLVPAGYSRESAQVLAEAIGGRIVTADPQSPDWEETLLRIAEAL
ncbi:MAG TPA: zinc ABC transporter substrate-binding protein [Thermoanaerobaculia bacterium]|nr:zinc ABC transporter substrate-binding protein [Thermoanaerobaculia bacterium]